MRFLSTFVFDAWRFKQASSGFEGAVELPSGGWGYVPCSVDATARTWLISCPFFGTQPWRRQMREETSTQTRLASRPQRLRDKDGVSAVMVAQQYGELGSKDFCTFFLTYFRRGCGGKINCETVSNRWNAPQERRTPQKFWSGDTAVTFVFYILACCCTESSIQRSSFAFCVEWTSM